MSKNISNTKLILISVVVFLLVLCFCCSAWAYGIANYKPQEVKKYSGEIGKMFNYDGMEVTLSKVDSLGAKTKADLQVDSSDSPQTEQIFAKGKFLLVEIKMKNVSKETLWFETDLRSSKTEEYVSESIEQYAILKNLNLENNSNNLFSLDANSETIKYNIYDVPSFFSDLYLRIRVKKTFFDDGITSSLVIPINNVIWKD